MINVFLSMKRFQGYLVIRFHHVRKRRVFVYEIGFCGCITGKFCTIKV